MPRIIGVHGNKIAYTKYAMALRKQNNNNAAQICGLTQFTNRREAGRALASKLTAFSGRDDLLLMAIPRGGVPVAMEISRQMSLPLHVLVVEKIQAPWHEAWQQRESIGAVGPGGVSILDADRIAKLAIPEEEVKLATRCTKNDQAHKEELYAVGSPSVSIQEHTIILVDDAIQTGASMRAAIQYLRKMKPARIVIATPVSSQSAYGELSRLADQLICATQAPEGTAVHVCYARFQPITDAAAYALLETNRRRFRSNQPAA